MDLKKKSHHEKEKRFFWQDEKFLKWIRQRVKRLVVIKSLYVFIVTCLSSTAFQSFTHFLATILAGALTFKIDSDNNIYEIRWSFLIPFICIYLTLLILFNIMNNKKTKQLNNTVLLESINKNVLELSVMQQSLLAEGDTKALDIIAQNTCRAVQTIICDFLSIDSVSSVKVTAIKMCNNEENVQMNGRYPVEDQNPSLYGVPFSIKRKPSKNAMSFVKIFWDNTEEGLFLKTEEEVKKTLAKNGNHPIHTKQLISIPGFVNNRIVVLLQIASKQKNLFDDDGFIFIAEKLTPIFIQLLSSTYIMVNNINIPHSDNKESNNEKV